MALRFSTTTPALSMRAIVAFTMEPTRKFMNGYRSVRAAALVLVSTFSCGATTSTFHMRFDEPRNGACVARAEVTAKEGEGHGVVQGTLPDGNTFKGELKWVPVVIGAYSSSFRWQGIVYSGQGSKMDIDVVANMYGEGVGKGVMDGHEYVVNMTGRSQR